MRSNVIVSPLCPQPIQTIMKKFFTLVIMIMVFTSSNYRYLVDATSRSTFFVSPPLRYGRCHYGDYLASKKENYCNKLRRSKLSNLKMTFEEAKLREQKEYEEEQQQQMQPGKQGFSVSQPPVDKDSSTCDPPMAPVPFYHAIAGVSGTDAANFLLEMTEKTNSDTFQLLKWPLPPLYILGNIQTTREMLTDQTTNKVPFIYQTYEQITGARTFFTTTNEELLEQVKSTVFKPTLHNPAVIQGMRKKFEEYAKDWIEERLDFFAMTGQMFDQ